MWEKVGNCVPCEKCELPQGDANMNIRYIPGTFDAELTCVEGVIKPGSQESSMAISCIEGGNWNLDVPVCSRPSVINCEDDYMEAIIDKNMLRANGWEGDASNIFLLGPGQSVMDIESVDKECFATEDGNGNYKLRIEAPFMGKCGTLSTIQGADDKDYLFSNQVKWMQQTIQTSKEANLLDFKCVYQGVFMAGLPHKVKLAINTKNYYDAEMDTSFTVSMSVYDRANYTGLVDNIPILHRGKRYFVDLHLHNKDMGTPYLKHCYGSNNFVSEQELKEKYRMQTASSSVRNMIVNGCPAPKTLVQLQESPTTYQSRFSFMFPKVGRGIADLQFVYLHCEIEMREAGYAPVCDQRKFDASLRNNFGFANKLPGQGLGYNNNGKMGAGGQGIGARAGTLSKPGTNGMTDEKYDAIMAQRCRLPWLKDTPQCVGMTRRRRSASVVANFGMSLGFGPLVVPDQDELADEHPSAESLASILEGSDIFVQEIVSNRIEDIIRDEAIELGESSMNQEEQIEAIKNDREARKIMIVSGMLFGCILLFAISVWISSQASCVCFKDSRKNSSKNKISTDQLACQIQRELSKN